MFCIPILSLKITYTRILEPGYRKHQIISSRPYAKRDYMYILVDVNANEARDL